MMSKKVESIKMLSIVVNGMIGIELLTLPITTVKYAKNDGWLSPILIGFFMIVTVYQGYWYYKNYPGLNFAEMNEVIFGKILGKIFLSINILYNIYIHGITLRLFAESISVFLLDRTPILIVILVTLLVVFYFTSLNFESITVVFDILLPFVLFSIILLSIISFSAVTPYNLFPPLHGGFMPILKGALGSLNAAGTCFIFAFILPMFSNPQETKKYTILGVIISSMVFTLITALCIMVFGASEINHLMFPTLTLSKAIQLQNPVFERTESLFMAAWIPNTITTLVVYFIISTTSIKSLFKNKKDSIIRLVQLPLILIICLLPKNEVELFKMLDIANIGLNLLNFVYLPIVTITIFYKKKGWKRWFLKSIKN